MNANELADNLEKHNLLSGYACMAADLLRQQQDEIEALKLHIKKLQWALAQQTNVLGENKSNNLGFQQIQLNADLLRKAQEKC